MQYSYTRNGNNLTTTTKLADGTIIAQTTTNGFGQVVVQAQPNTLGGFIYTRSEYNAKGQLVKTWADTGLDTTPTAATLYEYDSMGNVVKQTLALTERPSPENSPITESSFGAESLEDGVYSLTTTTRYNAAGQPLSCVQKTAHLATLPTLESKSVFVSERGLTSSQWSEYSGGTKRVQYSTVPGSSITAETVTVDGDVDFQPEYDADGNQCRVKTSAGIWALSYDAENRPTDFTSQAADGAITTVQCEYDYMGRRTTKMVTVGNNVTIQQRYIYRGYLQIACIDLTRSHHPALWFITWDPTQPVATRPLAIQKDGSWFTYGCDLTKNICEPYGTAGYIRTAYTNSPYGQVTSTGDVVQPIQ